MAAGVDVLMAWFADHEGLASHLRHEFRPCGLARAGWCQFGESGDVVHLTDPRQSRSRPPGPGIADLAPPDPPVPSRLRAAARAYDAAIGDLACRSGLAA